jgi:hypothetical protein
MSNVFLIILKKVGFKMSYLSDTKKCHNRIIFRKWLKENIVKFNYKPIPNTKGGFYFDGITKAISLNLEFYQPEAMVYFNNIATNETFEYFSIQYIGSLKYDSNKGFYYWDRVDKIYTYYPTYKKLIITEVFEEILNYCNKMFKDENSLYLIKYPLSNDGFIALSDERKVKRLQKIKANLDIKITKYSLKQT